MSVKTEQTRPADPTVSPLAYFGEEVRIERERINMSRAELGKLVHCSYSLVAKIESGTRVPTLDFARVCDATFPHSAGRFERFWPLALRYAFPPWFRPYAELEWTASVVRMFHPQLFPGLVQTQEYARAILRSGRLTNLDDLLTARLERQHVLTRERDPARLWLILRESVLSNTVGGRDVMREQLLHLRDLAETPKHRVQILRGKYDLYGAGSPWGMLSFTEGADVVHIDGFPTGYLLAEQHHVEAARDAYDLLKASAQPPDESAALIDTILKDHYS